MIRSKGKGDTIIVARVGGCGGKELRMTKPCSICSMTLKEYGIKHIHYSTDHGFSTSIWVNKMNYDFPIINNINDVLPHIEGKEEFSVMYKDDYTVINYNVAFEDTFQWNINDSLGSAIRRECRGLIFNSKTGDLISRPYSKFFNIGERNETDINKINLYEPHVVLEKLDGSMIRPIPTKEGFRLATKAGITDVAMNAEVFIADKPHYAKFINTAIKNNFTPIFEWCSRKNRIVVDYPEDQLILTAVRGNESGLYVLYSAMKEVAEQEGIPVVKAVDGLAVQNINLFVKQVREWDDGEGVVLRFNTGHMVKIKADYYVLRHKIKEQVSQEKNVIKIILEDGLDDLVPLLLESDVKLLQNFQKLFWKGVDEVSVELQELYNRSDENQSQKDFALFFVQSLLPKYQPFMFNMRKGMSAKDLLLEKISKSLSTSTTVENSRWMWNNYKLYE